ncbi:hypothetical protein [Ruegeria sp. THAF33]|uniref:hypothetical protein n=1 Tax=Ruegeria sp. THAF33 TaxID=2587853 RepID=UPI0012A7FC1B|nr:hypothetical protein [Ruegeria sp. THAF33]QFT73353.1 hypothetical protein FIU92_09965 [Ruegeria sp. THAF33]
MKTIDMLLAHFGGNVRNLLKHCGRYRLNDPELVKQFRDTAPYHRLEDLYASKK